MKIFITYIPTVKFLWILEGFLECMGTQLHLLSTLENMSSCSNELGEISGVEAQGQPKAALLLVSSLSYPVFQGRVLYLFFLHPIWGWLAVFERDLTSLAGGLQTFPCPGYQVGELWTRGVIFTAAQGMLESTTAPSILGMARQIWGMPPCCAGASCSPRALWGAGAVHWGWLLLDGFETLTPCGRWAGDFWSWVS